MSGSNFMQGWMVLAGSLVLIALILTAFGLMLGIVKPADALKRVGAILGIVIVLMPIPGVLVGAWSGNISVATYRSGRDWGRSLAVAAKEPPSRSLNACISHADAVLDSQGPIISRYYNATSGVRQWQDRYYLYDH